MNRLFVACSAVALGTFCASPLFAENAMQAPPTQSQETTPPVTPMTAPQQTTTPMTNQSGKTADLTGQMIYSATGDKIGTVASMTVDKQGQQAAVVKVEQHLGIGSKEVVFPMASLTAKSGGGYTTTLASSEIKKLPTYKGGGSD